jgi:hypothetical protein
LALLCAGGAVAVALPGLAAGTTRSASAVVYPKKQVHVVASSVINFRQLARLEALRGHRSGVARPYKMPEPQEGPHMNSRAITLPSPFGSHLLAEAGQAHAPSPSPTQSFLAQADAPRPSNGFIYIPPDTSGAVGKTKLMSTANSNYVIERKSDGAQLSLVGMDTFWGSVSAASPFDPKTYYDPYNNRWIVAAVNEAGQGDSSTLYGISDSDDPQGTWHLYKIDADSGNAKWADYPGVGFNKNALAITVNMFNISDNHYAGRSQVYVVNYPALLQHTAAAGTPTEIDVSAAFTIQPAVTYSPTEGTLYMVEQGSTSGGTYYFYSLSGTTLSGGTTELVNSLGGWLYPSGNIEPQSGGHPIDSGDSRILNAVYRNGNIYFAQTIGLGGTDFNPARTGVQWTEVNTSGNSVQGGRIVDSTATSSNGGHWYAYPSIAVNKNNDVILGFSEFQSTDFPDAGYAVHFGTDAAGTMRDPVTLKDGEGNYYKTFGGARNRWGDYSLTQIDPSDDVSLWTSEEYSKPPPASCGSGRCGTWSTWWGRVLGGSAPPSYTLTVSKSGTAAGAGTVTGNGINCGVTCSASFPSGTVVNLVESHPASTSTFGGWNGDCSGLGQCSVTMNGNKTVVATFYQKATPPACIVPKVVGKKLRAAKRAIRARHCKVGKVSYAKSTKKKKGRVIRQRPRAGSHRANGAKVNLVVGRGPKR